MSTADWTIPPNPARVAAELSGPSVHDGVQLDLPPSTIAVALVADRGNGTYEATLSVVRDPAVSRTAVLDAVLALALEADR